MDNLIHLTCCFQRLLSVPFLQAAWSGIFTVFLILVIRGHKRLCFCTKSTLHTSGFLYYFHSSWLTGCVTSILLYFRQPLHVRASGIFHTSPTLGAQHILCLLSLFILPIHWGATVENHSQDHCMLLTWATHFFLWVPLLDHLQASLTFSLDSTSTLSVSYYCPGAKGWILLSWLKSCQQNLFQKLLLFLHCLAAYNLEGRENNRQVLSL